MNSLAAEDQSDPDLAACVASYREVPLAIADDVARCVLELKQWPRSSDSGRPASWSCWHDETREYFERIEHEQQALDAVMEAIEQYERAHDGPPTSLADMPAGTRVRDAWGTDYRYTPSPGTSLVSAGPDRAFDTPDDLQGTQEFIYFQF